MNVKACKRIGGEWNPRTKRCKCFYTYEITVDDVVLFGKDDEIIKRYDMSRIVDEFLDKEGLEIF